MVMIEDREHRIARAEMIGAEGERWERHHAEAFAKLAPGTAVIIDIVTGEFVTASTKEGAHAAFKQRFGKEDRFGHSFVVERPIFIGGGLWLK